MCFLEFTEQDEQDMAHALEKLAKEKRDTRAGTVWQVSRGHLPVSGAMPVTEIREQITLPIGRTTDQAICKGP